MVGQSSFFKLSIPPHNLRLGLEKSIILISFLEIPRSPVSSIWPARSLFQRLSRDDGARRRYRGTLRCGIILRRRCLRHDRAQNSPVPAKIAPVDGSPRDENGQSFPRATTGMKPRLDSSRLGSTRLAPSPSFPRSPPPGFSVRSTEPNSTIVAVRLA